MLYLLLAIVLNTYLLVAFKVFERYGVDNLQAIVANYWVCVITGSLFIGRFPIGPVSFSQPWWPWALAMGAAFIAIFNLIAYCTKEDGITTTTIANKLSMVIPVAFALWLYGDPMSLSKGAGILLAVPAVYLSSRTKDVPRQQSLWPALALFFASGLLDTTINYVAHTFFTTSDPIADERGQAVYLVHAFFSAAVIGLGIVVGYMLLTGRRTFALKNVVAGIALGIPNYFSIYFLLRLLQTGYLPGSAAIPVNNIGIVLLASLTAVLFFREKAGAARIAGMVLSITAILLIMFADL